MRCPLLERERMFNRPKLTEVLSHLTVVADWAGLASTLWSTVRLEKRGGRRELDQKELIGLEWSEWKLRRDPR